MPQPSKPPREHPFEEYIVFRHRLRELLHLHNILLHLHECPDLSPRPEEEMQTLRLLIVSHVAGFFDTRPDSLKVLDVWREYFPQHRAALSAFEAKIKPLLGKALKLRHKAGAHSDLSIKTQNRARRNFSGRDALRFLDGFFEMANIIVKSERSVPRLAEEIAKWELLEPGEEIPLG